MALASQRATARRARELTYVRKDGTRLRVSQTADGRSATPTGASIGYLGVATDVTEQVRAQSALRRGARLHRRRSSTPPAAS